MFFLSKIFEKHNEPKETFNQDMAVLPFLFKKNNEKFYYSISSNYKFEIDEEESEESIREMLANKPWIKAMVGFGVLDESDQEVMKDLKNVYNDKSNQNLLGKLGVSISDWWFQWSLTEFFNGNTSLFF